MYVTLAAPRSLLLLATVLGISKSDTEIENPIAPQEQMVIVWCGFLVQGAIEQTVYEIIIDILHIY